MPAERKWGQDHGYYDWSPVINRKPLRWPNGARVAVVVIVNLEHYDWQLPAGAANAPKGPFRPNLAEYSQREYGNRVGRLPHFEHPRQARDQADDGDGQSHRRDQPVPGA